MKKHALRVTHLTPTDYEVQPWKNGKGETREIAREQSNPFRWRLSLASVSTSGPFSEFAGYQRSLTLLEGALDIAHDGKPPRRLLPFSPYGFSGDVTTTAQVETPARDFNLFTLRGKASGNVYPSRFSAGEEVQYPIARHEHFLFCAQGKMSVFEPNSEKEFTLSVGETLWAHREGKQEFLNLKAVASSGPALLLWVVVELKE